MTIEAPIHTWTMKRNSKLIRFYLWFYANGPYGTGLKFSDELDKSLAKLTFCRLFWAVVCAPFIVALTIGFGPLIGIVLLAIWIKEEIEERQFDRRRKRGSEEPKPEKVRSGPRRMEKILDGVMAFFDHIAAFFQKHVRLTKVLGFVVKSAFWIGLVGFVVAALGFLSYVGYTHQLGFVHGMEWAGAIIGGLAALLAVCGVIALLLLKSQLGKALGWFADKVWDGLCAIGRGGKFTGNFVAAGHHAVKYRTCPKVTIVD